MSAIVPWTNPFGPQCCCDLCYTDLANQPAPPYTTGNWADISPADFAAVYAGGFWSVSISANLSGKSEFIFPASVFFDNADINETNIPLTIVPSNFSLFGPVLPDNDPPCYQAYTSELFDVQLSSFGYGPLFPQSETIQTRFNIAVALATDTSVSPYQHKIQAFMLNALNVDYIVQNSDMTLQVGDWTSITDNVPYRFQTAAPPSASVSFDIGGNIYQVPIVYVKRRGTLSSESLNSISGEVSVVLSFSPPAP